MGASMLGAVAVGVVGPAAVAQEGGPEPVAFEERVQAALFAYPVTDGVPNTLTNSFPPQVVCVVRPELCTDASAPVRDPIGGAIGDADEAAEPAPGQPVQPDTLTVQYEAGNTRYQSGVTYPLPDVPEGKKVDSFVMRFEQQNPTYSADSPAFRQAVLAAVAGAGSQDPAIFAEEFAKALDENPVEQPPVGNEMCPFKSAYPIEPNTDEDGDGRKELENEPAEPGSAEPPAAATDQQIPEQDTDGDGVTEPNIDCLFGGNGVFDEEAGIWSFDLTFALQAWNDGTLDYNGVFLRPTGAPNLAFGDPDTSFNAAVTLNATTATYTLVTSDPPPPVAPLEPLPAPTQSSAPPAAPPPSSGGTGSSGGGGGGFTPSPITSSGGGGFQSGSAPVTTADPGPVTADAAEEPEPVVAQEQVQSEAPVAQENVAAPTEPGTYWLLWLLVPVFLLGMYMTSSALTSEELVTAGVDRHGAMSRLLENRELQSGGGPATV